jgi:hypothetical protein
MATYETFTTFETTLNGRVVEIEVDAEIDADTLSVDFADTGRVIENDGYTGETYTLTDADRAAALDGWDVAYAASEAEAAEYEAAECWAEDMRD